MLLTIAAESVGKSEGSSQAANLSFLLHKHPDRFQTFEMSFGQAHVFYPEVSDTRVTACLLLDVDPVGMAKKNRGTAGALAGYVNDRPYVTSSFMSTAIASVFGSAMAGRCKDRPTATTTPMELTIHIESLPVKGGAVFLRSLFEPLGYEVMADAGPLDDQFPDWGESPYLSVRLRTRALLSDVLNHLYVLIPVFDNQKHYFVGQDEIEKLLSKGQGWLSSHPHKEAITQRYLRHQRGMVRTALEQLCDLEHVENEEDKPESEAQLPAPATAKLNEQRLGAVVDELTSIGANRVIDLGCGEGKLLRRLLKQNQFTKIVGMDVSVRALEVAAKRLRLDSLPSLQAERLELIHGSLMYRDSRLAGFDAAAMVEVIEHLDPPRLAAMQQVIFEHARPTNIVVTTPNVEYNVIWKSLPAGKLRHHDHRFEWTRAEFEAWASTIATRHGYQVRFQGVGPNEPSVGTPTQMALFSLATTTNTPSTH
ncbi:MAG: 3' terminal RNA ribose 2'-O-methyltransferase Hen1 [Planctomycetota bacterium]